MDDGSASGESAVAAAEPEAESGTGAESAEATTHIEGGPVRQVRVEAGDSLGRLLADAGVPEAEIYTDYVALTLKLNPQIRNPNIIMAGQDLVLPVPGDWDPALVAEARTEIRDRMPAARPKPAARIEARPEPVVESEPEPARVAQPEPPRRPEPHPEAGPGPDRATARLSRTRPDLSVQPDAAIRHRPRPKPGPKPQPKDTALTPAPLPPTKSVATRTALGLIFTRIGESFRASGQHFLPLKSGGQITINNETFPIIEMRSGQRIVLDLELKLPEKMVRLIRTNWPNYTIFRPKPKESFSSMLGRLLEAAQYYKVQGPGAPWRVDKGVAIEAGADWIVWRTRSDHERGRAVIINLPPDPSMGTSPEVAAFLAEHGIQIIDFFPKGNLIGPRLVSGAPPREDWTRIEYHSDLDLVASILELIGQPYEVDLSIPLMRDDSGGDGFNLTVQAPLYFSRSGRNFIVTPNDFSGDVLEALEANGFRVVTIDPREGLSSLAQKTLEAMGIPTEAGLTIQASSRPKNANIELTLPGLTFSQGGRRFFLTPVSPSPLLTPLLDEPGLRVVRYQYARESG
jgi:hypothetical protein